MNTLVRHLTLWALRRTLRGGTFRFLALAYLLIPALVAYLMVLVSPVTVVPMSPPEIMTPAPPPSSVGARAFVALVFTQEALLFVLISLWTVGTIKRLIGSRVSDDWLLFMRYRDFLWSTYLSALALGLLLVVVGSPLELLVAAFGDFSLAQVGATLAALAVSVLIPVTVAAFIGGAQDTLMAHAAVVTAAVLGTGGLVYFLPLLFPAISPLHVLLTATGGQWLFQTRWADMRAVSPWPECLGLQAAGLLLIWLFSWVRAEDFWNYPGLAAWPEEKPKDANLAEVRQAIGGAVTTKPTPRREERFRWRQALRVRHDNPVFVYDLAARQRWLGDWGLLCYRLGQSLARLRQVGPFTWILIGWLLLLGAAALFNCFTMVRQALGPDFNELYFYNRLAAIWSGLSFVFLVAVVLGGAEVVAADRERGTLESLLLTRLTGPSLFRTKLAVVLVKARFYFYFLAAGSVAFSLLGVFTQWDPLAVGLLAASAVAYAALSIIVSTLSSTTLTAFFNALLLLVAPTVVLLLTRFAGGGIAPAWKALSPFLALKAGTMMWIGPVPIVADLLDRPWFDRNLLALSLLWHTILAGLAVWLGGRYFGRLVQWRGGR